MNDETIIDGGAPAVEPVLEKPVNPEVPLVETPEQLAEKAQAEEERKRKTGSQRAREKADRLERENQALRDALARGTQKEPEAAPHRPQAPTDGRPLPPKSSDFTDYDEYEAARDKYQEDLTDWKVEARLQKEKQESAQHSAGETYGSKVSKIVETHPDFMTLAEELSEEGIEPTEVMKQVVLASDAGHELLYHLAKNPQETKRIGALPPGAQLLELGMMLGRMNGNTPAPARPEVKPSQAPAPPKPIKGPATPSVSEKDLTDGDWLKAKLRR